MTKSTLQVVRASYRPKLPKVLRGSVKSVDGEATQSVADQAQIKKLFPNTYGMPIVKFETSTKKVSVEPFNVGVVLSGGQAPGGHNVISGLFDGMKRCNPKNRLFGFKMGLSGLVNHDYIELTADVVDNYRNTGGFDITGSARTKLESEEQFEKIIEITRKLNIKAIVIIGGDDSNTNASVLAEYMAAKKTGIQIIGVPKTIDGDLRCDLVETSFGFDTATKLYSELIGNIECDCKSARKYWHFIKLMGRAASHIALECALQTHPTYCLISEEILAKEITLDEIITKLATLVAQRSEKGEDFGVVLVPEGLIEFIPAINGLIDELNDLLAANADEFSKIQQHELRNVVITRLSKANGDIYASLPKTVASQLLLGRDPHGNIQVSGIETEKMLSEMVGCKLNEWKSAGKFNGKYAAQHHFMGYEGRCVFPSNFDANYCYALGVTACELIVSGKSGYMAYVSNLAKPVEEQNAGGVPLTMLMDMEHRNGMMKPVIRKILVDLNGAAFKEYEAKRDKWALTTDFVSPGPIQYFGPSEVCDQIPISLRLEHQK